MSHETAVCAVLDFLYQNSYFEALIALERESSIALQRCATQSELDFFRANLLNGKWNAVARLLATVSALHAGNPAVADIVREAHFVTRRQAILELMSQEDPEGPDVDRLVDEVRQLEGSCSQIEYHSLCFMLTLSRVTDHGDFKNWTPAKGRYDCWLRLAPSLQSLLSTEACEQRCPNGLLMKALNQFNPELVPVVASNTPRVTPHFTPSSLTASLASFPQRPQAQVDLRASMPFLSNHLITTPLADLHTALPTVNESIKSVPFASPVDFTAPAVAQHSTVDSDFSTSAPLPQTPLQHRTQPTSSQSLTASVAALAAGSPSAALSPIQSPNRVRAPSVVFTPKPLKGASPAPAPTAATPVHATAPSVASPLQTSTIDTPLNSSPEVPAAVDTPADPVRHSVENASGFSLDQDFHCVGWLRDIAPMRCVDVSPCGRYFAAGGTSRTLRVCTLDWDSIEHRTLVPLPKHDEDEEQISQQHNVNIAVERVMHHSGSIFCTQFDATGDLLATGSNDKTIKVMRVPALLDQSNTETQDKWYDPKHDITLFGHNGTVRALSFRPASSQLISAGSGDSRLRLWDIKNASMDPLLQLDGHTQCVFALQISQKGSLILSGGLDGVVRAWDLRAGGCCVDEFHVDGAVSGLALSSTDTFFVAGLANGTISKVDLRAGRGPLWRHNTHTDDCRSVLFRDAEQTVLSASFDSTLCLSDCQTGHIKRHAPCHAGKIVALAAVSSPTGKCDIALSASSDRSVKLWRL